jgi:predicted DNA-binding transcriptional regulator YafY
MKNVIKRSVQLLNLVSNNKKISTIEIKDSISEYRDLSDQAFRRSFERDKSLLRSFGYLLEYENDKWGFDQGYSLGGSYVFNKIKEKENVDIKEFISTYLLIKKSLNLEIEELVNSEIISKILLATNEKKRLGFTYLSKYRKVKPQGIRFHDGAWYLAAFEGQVLKTFKIEYINELKVGNKENLFNTTDEPFTFSWEDTNSFLNISISIPNSLYIANKSIFSHNLMDNKKNDEFHIRTSDIYGLVKFLLICEGSFKIISIDKPDLIKEVLNE